MLKYVIFSLFAVKTVPYIMENFTNLEVNVSGTIVLECKVNGIPHPTIAWLKNGHRIAPASGELPKMSGAALVSFSLLRAQVPIGTGGIHRKIFHLQDPKFSS